MNILTSWLSPSLMHAVAWTLLHFLWQGAALAALAAAAMAFCRHAAARYAIALSVLVLMLATPIATVVVFSQNQSHDDSASAAVGGRRCQSNWLEITLREPLIHLRRESVATCRPGIRFLGSLKPGSREWLSSACGRLAVSSFWSGSAASCPRM